jgi:NAD(P)-dependent dehydrogenase (short-subunit alcohol dehydrogenase family)
MTAREGDSTWTGRVVVVTGASKGIGAATARLFAARGARVVVHGRDADRAEVVRREIQNSGGDATVVLQDLGNPAACRALIEEAARISGRIDVLVNNAGANMFKGTLGTTLSDWDDCLDLDLRAVWLCSKEAVPHLTDGGSIVTVSSNHAVATLPGVFPYNVAKAGVNALTQSLAIELADRGIRVNAVSPGYVDTPINDRYFASFDDPAGARANAERLHLTKRLGRPAEVAEAIEFLASPASAFTTGTILTLDGGRSALLQDPS